MKIATDIFELAMLYLSGPLNPAKVSGGYIDLISFLFHAAYRTFSTHFAFFKRMGRKMQNMGIASQRGADVQAPRSKACNKGIGNIQRSQLISGLQNPIYQFVMV